MAAATGAAAAALHLLVHAGPLPHADGHVQRQAALHSRKLGIRVNRLTTTERLHRRRGGSFHGGPLRSRRSDHPVANSDQRLLVARYWRCLVSHLGFIARMMSHVGLLPGLGSLVTAGSNLLVVVLLFLLNLLVVGNVSWICHLVTLVSGRARSSTPSAADRVGQDDVGPRTAPHVHICGGVSLEKVGRAARPPVTLEQPVARSAVGDSSYPSMSTDHQFKVVAEGQWREWATTVFASHFSENPVRVDARSTWHTSSKASLTDVGKIGRAHV